MVTSKRTSVPSTAQLEELIHQFDVDQLEYLLFSCFQKSRPEVKLDEDDLLGQVRDGFIGRWVAFCFLSLREIHMSTLFYDADSALIKEIDSAAKNIIKLEFNSL